MEELSIEIKEDSTQRYFIYIDGHYFRACHGYLDLQQVISLLIESKFKKEYEGYI